MSATSETNVYVKMTGRILAGAVVGAVSGALFMGIGKSYFPLSDPAGMLSAVTGLVYVLIGLAVGTGALAPRTGALFLNVEDSDELREQRAMLGYAGVSCIFFGLFLMVLALAAAAHGGGSFTPPFALGAAVACLAAATLTAIWSNARSDELIRQVNVEASAFALHVAAVFFGGWAMLAHLGYVAWMKPLVLLPGLALIALVAIFWISGKKGMLKPR